ncbi:GntR family transcriptional regulator [Glutamicibacter endophyticus]
MRASEKVYTALRQDIVNWTLEPGTMLAEVDISERFNVSRTPVREALAKLVADGLAAPQRGRGIVVSEVSAEHLHDLFALRRLLECEASRLAARNDEHRAHFGELAERFARAAEELPDGVGRETYYRLVADLDARIDAAAANHYLTGALRSLRVHLQRVRRMAKDHLPRLTESAREHEAIARAIASGDDTLAAASTTVHLHRSLTHISSHATVMEGSQ